jgi:hypothetical protein
MRRALRLAAEAAAVAFVAFVAIGWTIALAP